VDFETVEDAKAAFKAFQGGRHILAVTISG